MANGLHIAEVTEWNAEDLNSLCSLLIAVVADGASIGFLPPLTRADARLYWEHLLEPSVRLWVALYDGEVVGTVQLHLSMKQNGAHRAEIAKLMVHPQRRRLGIARQLMDVAGRSAMEANRSLLVLDTRAGDPSNVLYRSLGFVEAGRIPQYALSADGQLDETVIYYRFIEDSQELDLPPNRTISPGTLHHVEINVSNLQRSVEFWGWLLGYLGYEPYQNWTTGLSWRKGGIYIVLVQTESDYLEPRYHRKHAGLNHLAFYAESRQQVDELTNLLRTMGWNCQI
ncbi:GNAT family N-acetyltransferase [Ferroacidibacillus organovorans]|uniref:GNAT family N-acetyltransferase n=1 Tax=Ferroacidibacillus organovorans TaxID=1765683 RepID=UPI00082B2071